MSGKSVHRALILAGAVLALAMAVVVGVVQAQTPVTITMVPTGAANAGLAGTVTLTPMSATQVRVDIRVTGLAPNSGHAAHIHSPGTQQAACDTGGPIVYPLTDVQADGSGTGTSTSTVTFDAAKGIPTTGWYVNVHTMASTAGTGAGIICALANPGSGGPPASAAPRVGTGGLIGGDQKPLAQALALAGLLLAGAGVGLALARRRA